MSDLDEALTDLKRTIRGVIDDPSGKLDCFQRAKGRDFLVKWDEWQSLADKERRFLSRNVFIFMFTFPIMIYFSRKASKKYEELEIAQKRWIEASHKVAS